jgi:hypothetical protein
MNSQRAQEHHPSTKLSPKNLTSVQQTRRPTGNPTGPLAKLQNELSFNGTTSTQGKSKTTDKVYDLLLTSIQQPNPTLVEMDSLSKSKENQGSSAIFDKEALAFGISSPKVAEDGDSKMTDKVSDSILTSVQQPRRPTLTEMDSCKENQGSSNIFDKEVLAFGISSPQIAEDGDSKTTENVCNSLLTSVQQPRRTTLTEIYSLSKSKENQGSSDIFYKEALAFGILSPQVAEDGDSKKPDKVCNSFLTSIQQPRRTTLTEMYSLS